MCNKGRNIHARDCPAISCTDFHCVRDSGHILAAVAWDMCIDTALDRTQQRGLAVVTAAHDHRNARLNSHPAEGARVGELDLGLESGRGSKGNSVREGELGDPAAARKDRAVGDEGNPAALAQDGLERAVVLVDLDVMQEVLAFALNFGDIAEVVESVLDSIWNVEVENLRGAAAQNRATARGHTNLEAEFDAVGFDRAGAALEDLNAGGHDLKVIQAPLAKRTIKGAQEVVCAGQARLGRRNRSLREPHFLRRRNCAHLRRRSIRIGLDAVDGQRKTAKIP